jgi:hypothetical protein
MTDLFFCFRKLFLPANVEMIAEIVDRRAISYVVVNAYSMPIASKSCKSCFFGELEKSNSSNE